MQAATDDAIWTLALPRGLTIVSKDADFHQRSFLFGHPPKVVWIRLGNCSTDDIATVLRRYHVEVLAFENDDTGSFLALG